MIETVKTHFEKQPNTTILAIDGIRVTTPYDGVLFVLQILSPLSVLGLNPKRQKGLKR